MSDTLNLANSIWPNGMKVDSDGHAVYYPLGTNKVNVPTSSAQWPKGNKLISPFVYQDDKLVGFCDTKAMEVGDATTIVMPYEHIEADFSSIDKGTIQIATPKATTKKASWKNGAMDVIPEAQYKYKGCKTVDDVKAIDSNYKTTDIVDGTWTELLCDLEDARTVIDDNSYWSEGMFSYTNLAAISSDLTSLTNGGAMFKGTNLTMFDISLPNLKYGREMFRGCGQLSDFNDTSFSKLIDGYHMFEWCSNLTTFTGDLSSLTNSENMFSNCSNLTTFTSDLGSLTNAEGMFGNCSNLTTFTSDLSSLTNGRHMFRSCYNFTAFTSDLSSLANGYWMFYDCRLNTTSIQNIANTIKDVNGLTNDYNYIYKQINIGIGNTTPNEQETEAFNTMVSKGWTVYVNGSWDAYVPSSTALIPTDEEISQVIPFWAKPVPSVEEHAKYVDVEGNYYNILGAQFIYGDDISTYGMFTCEEDAAANMRLTPYTKPQTKTTNE